jgi:hypothetical protein
VENSIIIIRPDACCICMPHVGVVNTCCLHMQIQLHAHPCRACRLYTHTCFSLGRAQLDLTSLAKIASWIFLRSGLTAPGRAIICYIVHRFNSYVYMYNTCKHIRFFYMCMNMSVGLCHISSCQPATFSLANFRPGDASTWRPGRLTFQCIRPLSFYLTWKGLCTIFEAIY